MRVTEVKVFPVEDDKLKAFVSVVFDGCFMVNDIKVIEGRDGRFISMPSRRKRSGRFKDIAHPLNSETRRMLEGEILEEYDRVIDGKPTPAPRRDAAATENGKGDLASTETGGERTAAEAAPEAESADDRSPTEPAAAEPGTLEEITEKHLSDTFWTS